MWFIGCLAMILIGLALYGGLFNFGDPRGTSPEAKQEHDAQGAIWWVVFLVGLPVGVAVLTAMGGS